MVGHSFSSHRFDIRRLVSRIVIAAAFLQAAGCAPPEKSVRPGVNDEYKTTPVSTWVERFESESREIFRERQKILDATGVRQGMSVADVGAGTGLFTEMFAKTVGEKGRVYAVEITPDFLARIRERTEQAGLGNVTTILCTDRDSKLPAGSVDMVFLCDTYHHFEYPQSTLASIRKALRSDGRFIVVDFERIEGKSRPWVLEHVRAGREVVTKEIEAAGFALERQVPTPFLSENYMLQFRRNPGK